MKRLLALLLCLVLALSLIPAAAAEDIELVDVDETEEDLITIVDPEAPEAVPNAGVAIDSGTFPDSEFRRYIRDFLDEDGNGYLSAAEISEAYQIASWQGETTYGVHSLEGLAIFTELSSLYCEGWQLDELDVSHNFHLQDLNCEGCGLCELDLTNNPKLHNLFADGNCITLLQIGNCPGLIEAYHSSSGESGDALWYSGSGVYMMVDMFTVIDTNPIEVTPTITTQPVSKSTTVDKTVKFSVEAAGGNLSYQWQYRKNSSDSWHNSTGTGNKTATLSVKATEARNGFQFRCRVKNSEGTAYSKYAKLTVCTKPTITTQPNGKTAFVNTTVKFTVKATGGGLSYQWQYRKNSSSSWYNSTGTGNRTATLSVTATETRNGYQFRCKVSNVVGTAYSSAAKLTVSVKPVITTQPTSKTAAKDSTVKFTVKATGATSYQWQYRKNSSDSWHNSTGTGNKTATLSVTATEARNGFQFRCKVSNAKGSVYSNTAKLTILTKPTITTQPSSSSVTAGSTVKFKVVATGATSYQWQYRKSSSDSWHNSSSTGAKTATLTVDATMARNGYQFRCKVTNAAGSTYSNYAKLTVK